MMIQKRGDVDGVSLLLQRRIQFHPARKPLKPFSANSISNSSFHLETLNPSDYNNQRTSISNSSSASAEQVKDHYTNSPSPVIDPELCFNMSVRRIGAGLENLGNTCYLNSVLQCLTYTEPFAAYLQSGKHKSSCHTAGFCAMCAIQNHVKRALQSSGRILAPNDLVRNLRCISRTFGKARQEDAHEYMVNLLESMHKCCLPSGMPSESPSAFDISLVHKIFGGRLRSQVKCMQCSYCSDTFDPFLDLSLEIMKSDSLHKALSHFTAVEQLDGGGRQYQCERCKQKVKALKQLTVDKAPYVLSIHLKRFGSHAPGQKIDKKVEFGPTLDLKPFVSNSNDVDLKYTLYGVLVHAGWSSHSGHYFCFVRTSSGMWHSLDDNRVVQVSERTVMQQKAYMLFYVRDRKISAPKKQIVRKESLPSDHEKGDMFASVKQKKTFQSALVAARLDSFKKPQVKESCILNIPKSSVMAGAFSHLKDPTSQSSLKVLVNDCAVEQQPNCPSAELHAGSTLSSIVINNVNLQNDYEVERPSNEHSLQKAIDNGLPSMVCDREEQFIKTCKRNKCVQKALTDNNNLPKVLKPKKKVMKLRVASVHLGSRFMIKAMLSSYKKNKKQKTNKCQRLKVKSLIGEKYKKDSVSESLEPSASVKKKLRDLVSTHSERSRKNSCLASGSLSESFCENGSVSMLSRGIEEFTVARWDEAETSPSEIVVPEKGQDITIGYVPDEWDEEYDRGKRKKVRNPKDSFSGSNPFQELATKKAKLRNVEVGRTASSKKQPLWRK